MTVVRRQYLRAIFMAAVVLALAAAAVASIEYFGSAFLSGRSATAVTAPATTSASAIASNPVMSLHSAPRLLPEIRFQDGEGQPLTLTGFRGKVVLLNIWATWCGPCRREMPTLDRLQAKLGGPDFQVVALSIDRAKLGVVTEFYDEIGIKHLAKYIDESGKAARQLNAVGLPTTLLIDREGREIGRHVGPAEWDTPEMVALIQQQVGRVSGALEPGPVGEWAHGPDEEAVSPVPQLILQPASLSVPGTNTSYVIPKGDSS